MLHPEPAFHPPAWEANHWKCIPFWMIVDDTHSVWPAPASWYLSPKHGTLVLCLNISPGSTLFLGEDCFGEGTFCTLTNLLIYNVKTGMQKKKEERDLLLLKCFDGQQVYAFAMQAGSEKHVLSSMVLPSSDSNSTNGTWCLKIHVRTEVHVKRTCNLMQLVSMHPSVHSKKRARTFYRPT